MKGYRIVTKGKREGSILDFMSIGICIIAMSLVMLAMFSCANMIRMKSDMGQITRRYLLRMETVGYLTAEDKQKMLGELVELGVQNISFCDTTCTPVSYGDEIVLHVKGTMKGEIGGDAEGLFQRGLQKKEIAVEERKTSTAKN